MPGIVPTATTASAERVGVEPLEEFREALADHEDLGTGVFHDRGEFVSGQVGVQRDEVQARFLGGQRALDQRVAVVGQHADRIAGLGTERPEQVGDLVGVAGEFGIGARSVGALEDGGELGLILGDPPETQAAVPGVVHRKNTNPFNWAGSIEGVGRRLNLHLFWDT